MQETGVLKLKEMIMAEFTSISNFQSKAVHKYSHAGCAQTRLSNEETRKTL
jgi:hypothetical protein